MPWQLTEFLLIIYIVLVFVTDNVELGSNCGDLSLVGPAFKDRNITLEFIPSLYTNKSNIEWKYISYNDVTRSWDTWTTIKHTSYPIILYRTPNNSIFRMTILRNKTRDTRTIDLRVLFYQDGDKSSTCREELRINLKDLQKDDKIKSTTTTGVENELPSSTYIGIDITTKEINSKTQSSRTRMAGFSRSHVEATSKGPEQVDSTRHDQGTNQQTKQTRKHHTEHNVVAGETTPIIISNDKHVVMPAITDDDFGDRTDNSRAQQDSIHGIEREPKPSDDDEDSNNLQAPIIGGTIAVVVIVVAVVVIILLRKRRKNAKASHPTEVRYIADGNQIEIVSNQNVAANQNVEAIGTMYASVVPRSPQEASQPNQPQEANGPMYASVVPKSQREASRSNQVQDESGPMYAGVVPKSQREASTSNQIQEESGPMYADVVPKSQREASTSNQIQEESGLKYAGVVPKSQREVRRSNPCPAQVHETPSNERQKDDPDQLTYADLDLEPASSSAPPRPPEPATEYTTIAFAQNSQQSTPL